MKKPHLALSTFYTAAILLLASCSSKPLTVQHYSQQHYDIAGNTGQDSAMNALIHPYKVGVDTQMQVVIGHTDILLTKAQPESTLGNFMADAVLKAGKNIDPAVVGAVINYGSIRIPQIPPGPITKGKIFELMPFDNMLAITEVPGPVLRRFCNYMAKYKGWPVAGITFTIKDTTAQDIKVAGAPIDDSRTYKVALNDYTARGGDNCSFLVPLKTHFTSIFVRDALLGYIMDLKRAGKPLHPQVENRITNAQ